MSQHSHKIARRTGSALEQDQAWERVFGGIDSRIRLLETGGARGSGASFSLPLTLVGRNGTYTLTEGGAGGIFIDSSSSPGSTIPQGPGSGLNADLLDGFDSTYFLDFSHLTNVPDFDAMYVNADGDQMTGDLEMLDSDVSWTQSVGGASTWTLRNDAGVFKLFDGALQVFAFNSDGSAAMDGKLTIGANVATNAERGVYFNGPTDPLHAMYRLPGPWSGPEFQQLRISWPEGIQLFPGSGVGVGPSTRSFVEILSGLGMRITSGTLQVISGGFASAATPFYLDGDGNFSVFDKLYFESGLNTPDGFASLTVIGRIRGAIDNTPVVPEDSNTFYVGAITVSSVAQRDTLTTVDGDELQISTGTPLQLAGSDAATQEAVIETFNSAGVATAHTFLTGDTVIINGIPGACNGLNGAWVVVSQALTTFTIRSLTNAPFVGVANGSYAATANRTTTTTTGTAVSGQNVITVTSAANLFGGMYLIVAGVPVGTQIAAIDGLRLTLTANLTANITAATSVAFYGSSRIRELTLGLHKALNGSPAGYGVRLDESNYWFVNNQFRVGTSVSFVKWDGTTLKTSGIIEALGGNFSGKVTVNNGTMAFGTRVDPLLSKNGIYVTANDFWYSTGEFSIGGVNGISYAGAGNINIGTGVVITGAITGGSINIGSPGFHVDSSGNTWVGNAVFGSAPFRVSTAGAITATSMSAVNIAISGASTFAGTITSTSTITGGTLQTAAAGDRIVMTGSALQAIASGGGVITLSSVNIQGVGLESNTNMSLYTGTSTGYILLKANGPTAVPGLGTNQIVLQATTTRILGDLQGSTIQGTVVQASRNQQAFGPEWFNAPFIANANAGTVAYCWLPGVSAPQIRAANSDNTLYVRDSGGNTPSNISANACISTSSRRYKTNIAEWPARSLGAAVESPLDVIGRLRPKTFQQLDSVVRDLPEDPRRLGAYVRLARYQQSKGVELYELPVHDCATASCPGTADAPCGRRLDHDKGYLGFIAEEMEEDFPIAVHHDADGRPDGINYDPLTALALRGIQELRAEVENLRAQLAAV